jgi:hypothetical protein
MGFFDFLKKRPEGAVPPKETWESLERPARIEKIVLPLFERIGQRAGASDVRVAKVADGEEAALVGAVDGMPCRVHMSWTGNIDVEVRHDEELEFLDLEYDVKALPDATSWEDKDKKIALAKGVFGDAKAKRELEKLPDDLRRRIVGAVAEHRIRYFRSRRDETTVSLGELPGIADPEVTLAALLQLAVETAKARGATPSPMPGAPFDPARPFAGWRNLSQETKWERVRAFADGVAQRVKGHAKVDPDEHHAEIRWKDEGRPLRIELDVGSHVLPGALASGIDGTFDIYYDRNVTVREDMDDEWDEEGMVFLAPSIVLRGDEASARTEMALVSAIPDDLRDELFAAMVKHELIWLSLDDGVLDVRLPHFTKTDDGALPRCRAEPTQDRVIRCRFCRALWFPTATRASCTHCGAPP